LVVAVKHRYEWAVACISRRKGRNKTRGEETSVHTLTPSSPPSLPPSLPPNPSLLKHGVSGDDYEEVLEKVHAAIREDPTPAPKEAWSGDRAKYKRQAKVGGWIEKGRRREGRGQEGGTTKSVWRWYQGCGRVSE